MRHLWLLLGLAIAHPAWAEHVDLLLPGPMVAGLGPFLLADRNGFFRDEGLEVSFMVTKGGVEAAKQVGAGNGDVAVGVGDTPILMRANGVPVKTIGLMGGHALMQLVSREDAGVHSLADLKGKIVTVTSYQDTAYYVLLAALKQAGVAKDAVKVESLGPSAVWQMVAAGQAQSMVGVPDWAAEIEAKGVPITWIGLEDAFPTMAMAMLSSDKIIAERPRVLQGFVRAVLRAMVETRDETDRATAEYVAAVPGSVGREAVIRRTFELRAKLSYPGQSVLGASDPAKLDVLQKDYLAQGLIREIRPVSDYYTNMFVGG